MKEQKGQKMKCLKTSLTEKHNDYLKSDIIK